MGLDKETPEAKGLLKELQRLEHEGYHFEAAEGSFELLLKRHMKRFKPFFTLEGFRVVMEKRGAHAASDSSKGFEINPAKGKASNRLRSDAWTLAGRRMTGMTLVVTLA